MHLSLNLAPLQAGLVCWESDLVAGLELCSDWQIEMQDDWTPRKVLLQYRVPGPLDGEHIDSWVYKRLNFKLKSSGSAGFGLKNGN